MFHSPFGKKNSVEVEVLQSGFMTGASSVLEDVMQFYEFGLLSNALPGSIQIARINIIASDGFDPG